MTIPKTTTEIDSKPCIKCGGVGNLSEYSKNQASKDGHSGTCKSCEKAYRDEHKVRRTLLIKAYHEKNPEKMAAYSRKYKEENKARISEWAKSYAKTTAGKASRARACANAHAKHPCRRRAHNAINNAVQSGRVVKPSSCSSCNSTEKLDGHHHSYLEEHWLDVVWLCRKCHVAEHKRLKKEGE